MHRLHTTTRLAATLALALTHLVLITGCMTPPQGLDLALTRTSDAGLYRVTLRPPAQAAAINQLHAWQLSLTTPAGMPVPMARIRVDGGMPQHGHGLPTRPQVTRELPGGGYRIEGMKFSMTGWWEIKLAIDGPVGPDRVTFNTVVAEAGAPPADPVRWRPDELAVLASLSLQRLPPAPADPSNAVERQPAAIAFGQRLFNDTRLSRNGAVACATCHQPGRQFQDGLALSRGLGTGVRRAMPIVGAGHATWLFWDGRKDSLWAQALGPLEDGLEHGSNRLQVAHRMAQDHRAAYEALFGALPPLAGLPADAGPHGDAAAQAAWAGIDPQRQAAVSRVFANVGKAIAAYEKSLPVLPTRLDGYIAALQRGDRRGGGQLQADELRGLRLFIGKAQCVSCHGGPLFSDQQFHNTGVPPRDAARPDRGRAAATAAVRGDEFNCLGPFSDAPPGRCQELRFMVGDDPALEGAFKTPGLRGVADRPPYMHAGQFGTLAQVLRHYVAAPPAAVGHSELRHRHAGSAAAPHAERAPIELNEAEIADLARFLGTLSPP